MINDLISHLGWVGVDFISLFQPPQLTSIHLSHYNFQWMTFEGGILQSNSSHVTVSRSSGAKREKQSRHHYHQPLFSHSPTEILSASTASQERLLHSSPSSKSQIFPIFFYTTLHKELNY